MASYAMFKPFSALHISLVPSLLATFSVIAMNRNVHFLLLIQERNDTSTVQQQRRTTETTETTKTTTALQTQTSQTIHGNALLFVVDSSKRKRIETIDDCQ